MSNDGQTKNYKIIYRCEKSRVKCIHVTVNDKN